MLRAENIADLDQTRSEIDTYNELIPNDGELSATMLTRITEQAQIRPRLARLIGIDKAAPLHVGQRFVIPAVFEAGRSKEDSLSAVQYVRFAFSPEARVAFRGERQEAKIVTNPPRYQAQTVLSPETVTLQLQNCKLRTQKTEVHGPYGRAPFARLALQWHVFRLRVRISLQDSCAIVVSRAWYPSRKVG